MKPKREDRQEESGGAGLSEDQTRNPGTSTKERPFQAEESDSNASGPDEGVALKESGDEADANDVDAEGEDASEVEKGKATHLEEGELREILETSSRGAPSVGEAVSDIFSTDEIFHRILATADSEFSRSNRLLFLSGLTAGLSIGLTFLGRATFAGALGHDPTGFLENAFYPVGFIFIILGRQQLFTENTLTPVTLVLMRLSSIPRLLRLWGIVYVANILGAVLMAILFSATDILSTEAAASAYRFGIESLEPTWGGLFVRGMLAGFMVAGMVWLIHAVRSAGTRFVLVYLIIFLIPSTGLFHCIIGACEIAYFVIEGGTSISEAIFRFEIPVTLGNVAGGVLFVALPNFFQTGVERFMEWEQLSWQDWIRGRRELAGHANSNSNDGSTEER